MPIILLILIPFTAGLISFFIKNDYFRRGLIIISSGIHIALTCSVWFKQPPPLLNGYFALDDTGILFLTITSVLFFGASLYGISYLSDEKRVIEKQSTYHRHASVEATFTGCFLLFFSTMTIVIVSQDLAVLWVAIEATTLASAPLIYFHRTKRSLEATWKYLLICSVGIALALLGIFFLAVANTADHGNMLLPRILEHAGNLNISWLKAAFLLFFVGYGTKMGLAPFHTWLPDAHSEAPSVVSALLSGALLNCAFLGILRSYQICYAAGLGSFCQEIFIFFGLLSVLFAAIFILGQTDYKRMLAYSSVEHMGIIALGIGLGGKAVFAALIGMLGHSLTKAGLFFVAGNILSYYRTKKISDIHGLISGKIRTSAILWIIGFLLITGTPPSGIFIGKFIILKEALLHGNYIAVLIFLAALSLVFIGMSRIVISMTQGVPNKNTDPATDWQNAFFRLCPSAIFFILVIVMGIYLPNWLTQIIETTAKKLGGF
ncbi:MAG: proton-conducting transporter membrane subunit [Candidatus Auribacterota bacterium]|jgi:hydrogenase-4 component F|nr:proton-conducting transporter membrane subunit [Candidatus Auribacterota bacterium]